MHTIADIEAKLLDMGLSEETARKIAGLSKPSVVLESIPVADEGDIRLGATKIGGRPDLPAPIPWPWREPYSDAEERGEYDEEIRRAATRPCPLSFVAQIDLAEVAAAGPTDPDLPKEGRLFLFYDVFDMPWGLQPAALNGSRLIYDTSPVSDLIRVQAPDDSVLTQFEALAVRCEPSLSSLSPQSGEALEFIDEDAFSEWSQWHEDNDEKVHHVGGHPSQIQGDMAAQCVLVSHGLTSDAWVDEEAIAHINVEAEREEWVFLFQIASDEEHDMVWDDLGLLYVWIKRSDLKARRFDKAHLILQCH
ncbi:DUF1963 domain-containing protein [Microvirga sp. ACRRW]|uniref:YwqG family protein n=1 Tax=Microvirga sp. ACRRW TaxID=2918205 RepID=UPI001EF5E394|nr:YwqG family protein [Microvirga sp. ACRRW]MCG7391431.1 DUF1963 domain-containing protein [Microvirga sp. ACRRW]